MAIDVARLKGRQILLHNLEDIMAHAKKTSDSKSFGMVSMFGDEFDKYEMKMPTEQLDVLQALKDEKDAIGLYLTGHPFEYYEGLQDSSMCGVAEIKTFSDAMDYDLVIVSGIIVNVEKKSTKKGDSMCILKIADNVGEAEVVVFPKQFEKFRHIIQEDEAIMLVVRTEYKDDSFKMFAESVIQWSKTNHLPKTCVLRMNYEDVGANDIARLYNSLKSEFRGHTPLRIMAYGSKYRKYVTYDSTTPIDIKQLEGFRTRFPWLTANLAIDVDSLHKNYKDNSTRQRGGNKFFDGNKQSRKW